MADLYFPSRALGLQFGCERKIPENIEYAFEKYLRFKLLNYKHEKEPITYHLGEHVWPFSAESLAQVRKKKFDDLIVGTEIVMLVLPDWSFNKIANRHRFWTSLDSRITVRWWCPDLPGLQDQMRSKLRNKSLPKYGGITRFKDSFADNYYAIFGLNKFIEASNPENTIAAS